MSQIMPTKQISNTQLVCNMIGENREAYKNMLPAHIAPEKFIRTAQAAVLNIKDLASCTKQSIYLAIEQAAKDGLPIDNKQATIVIFNENIGTKINPSWAKVAKYTPMIAGLRTLARNTGSLSIDVCEIVYQNDSFLYHIKNGKVEIDHSPLIFKDRGPAVGVYATCIARETGEVIAEVLTKDQIENIRKCSKVPGSLMWTTFWEEGWKKSAYRRLWKRLPSSSDKENSNMDRFASASQRDDDMYEFNDSTIVEANNEQPQEKPTIVNTPPDEDEEVPFEANYSREEDII